MTAFPADPSPATGLGARLKLAAADIKLSHSVFAMPFALLGAVLARPVAEAWSVTAQKLALVVACMVLARTWAMLVNRIADARIDADNPRTAGRAVASGRLPAPQATLYAGVCAALFVAACSAFWLLFANPWPVALSVPVLGWLALYSFAKRFTAACHLLLGTALAISPIAACLAVHPPHAAHPAILLIAGFVTLWVAGFDILYALQDETFDRAKGLFSIPAWLGARRAAWLSRVMHTGAVCCLGLAWCAEPRFGPVFGGAVALAACLLVFEHIVLVRRGLSGLPMAFFTLNGCVSLLVGAAGIADVLWT
ncbi:MAG TPA: 4-hydroxybenzoate octaprenyltransferase [Phycisphaerales bacterium]|nr:4-hydroxybenzoate octaprenyltransferase [Phycisphaerales bacterium]